MSRIFDDNGFGEKLRAAREDEEGVDIGFLEEGLRGSEERAVAEGNLVPVSLSLSLFMLGLGC